MLSRPSSAIAALILMLGAFACSTNREVLAGPEPRTFSEYLAAKHPSDIKVTDKNGRTHWFHHPVVEGDTLRGERNHELPQPRLAIAIADVDRVEEPHFSPMKTVGYFGAFNATIALVIVVIASGTHYSY